MGTAQAVEQALADWKASLCPEMHVLASLFVSPAAFASGRLLMW